MSRYWPTVFIIGIVLAWDVADVYAQPSIEPPRIEVAFVVDATGSMGSYIAQARAKIKGIAEDLATGDPAPHVRFALVAYRDRSDAFVTKVHAFTDKIAEIKDYLDKTSATGGGDTPEAVLEGVHDAIKKLKWSTTGKVIKLIYLVGDAPAKRYAETPNEAALTKMARDRGIVIHTIVCGGNSLPTFDTLALLSEGRTFRLNRVARGTRITGGGPRSAGAGRPDSLDRAVTSSAKAYSESVGVKYDEASATKLTTQSLPVPGGFPSGLLGAQVRWVRDRGTWADLWAAHTSLTKDKPPPPKVDFSTHALLVMGGSDAGLELVSLSEADGTQVANVRPGAEGVTFYQIEARKSR